MWIILICYIVGLIASYFILCHDGEVDEYWNNIVVAVLWPVALGIVLMRIAEECVYRALELFRSWID